jgi:hypothetical protein
VVGGVVGGVVVGVVGGVVGVVGAELDGELGVPMPVHATPLKAKPTGAPFVPEYVAWKPKPTVAPVATDPLYGSLAALTCCPLWLACAFQAEVTCWFPLHDQVAVQALTAGPLFVTVTSAVKPVLHWFT